MTFETVLLAGLRRCPTAVPPALTARRTAEAEAELSAALAEATRTLAKLDIAQWRPELAGAHRRAAQARRRHGPAARATTRGRAGCTPGPRVLDRVLALAEHAAPGGAINGYEVQQRDAALRPLTTACRRALVAACNAADAG